MNSRTEVEAARARLSFRSYYLDLRETGSYEVDVILSAVARAGKAYHSTEFWVEPTYPEEPFKGEDWNDRIQNAGIAAAAHIEALEAENERLVRDVYGQGIHVADLRATNERLQEDLDAAIAVEKTFGTRINGQHARIEALEAALRAAHSVLDDMLGPCEPGCDCVLHELRALLPEARAMKFRKKPVVIEARQIGGYTDMLGPDGIAAWCGGVPAQEDPGPAYLLIPTSEGTMRADVFDWIIKGVEGEFYPCKPDIFDATYEPVDARDE